MDVEKLIEKGFTNRQISQLIFIEEAGVDLENIDILTPVEKLMKFRKDLAEEKFYSNQILTIRNLNKNGYDVSPLLDLSIPRERYYKLEDLIMDGFDVSRLADPKLSEQNFDTLVDCIFQHGVQYPFLESDRIFSNQIEECFDLLAENPGLESIFSLNISKMRLKFAIEIASACQIAGVKFNIEEMIDEKFSDQQVMQIASLARYGINLLDYCDEKFDYEQMCAISTGLTEGVDVSIFNKLRYNASQMDVILEALCYNKDADNGEKINIDILLDSRYSAAHMQLMNQCMQEGKNVEHIANVNLNFLQALEILRAEDKGYDISLFLENNLSGREMHLLNAALAFKEKYNVDIDTFMKNKTLLSKFEYLISLITKEYAEINLSDKDDIDSVINNATNDRKEFYSKYERYIENEYNVTNGIIKTEYCSLPCPLSDFIHSGDEIAVDEAFAEAYFDDIEAVVEMLACIDYDVKERCYLIRNVYDGTIAAELDINEFYSKLSNVFDKQEQIIIDTMENVSYNNGNDEVLFDDVCDVEKYGGPSFKRLAYIKEIGFGCEYIFVLEKELKERFGNVSDNLAKIKKQINDESIEYTAWYFEDTYRATYSQEKEIREKHFYGSFDERQKLEKSFGVKILDEIEKER